MASTFVLLQLWRIVPTPRTRRALYGLARVHLGGKRCSAFDDSALFIGIMYIQFGKLSYQKLDSINS